MKKTLNRIYAIAPALLVLQTLWGQGQNQFQSTGFGDQYLISAPPLFPAAPRSVNIGDGTTFNIATLNVRGDQMPVLDPYFIGGNRLCTFRTDVPALREQSWWMYRDANHIGRIWADGGHRAFHFQNMEPVDVGLDRYSGAMVQNHQNDGLWVSQNGVPEGIRTFPNVLQVLNRDGYVALGASEGWLAAPTTTDVRGPWTRLHLFDQAVGTRPYFGWRSQMRNGITFTGNSDQAYIGQKYNGNDNTDFVIHWSDNPDVQPWGTDRMKFIFSSVFTGAHTGMGSEYGLEAMRFWPKNANEVNVGVGDFYAYGGDSTERLHVRDGRVRIRQLPTDPEANTLNRLMVVDNTGVVNWRYLPPSITTGCDQELNALHAVRGCHRMMGTSGPLANA